MQRTALEFVKGTLATVIGYIGWFLGGFDGLLIALLIFMAIDIATGVMVAFIEKVINSKISFKGICKKVMILFYVGLAYTLDIYVLQSNAPIREIVICFYLFNEGISITENSAKLGLPVPQRLIDVLQQLKGEEDNE